VLIVGGPSGSGISSLARAARRMLIASDFAVSQIDVNKFLRKATGDCNKCWECTELKDCGVLQCYTSPDAISLDLLNASINREASTMAESEAFIGGRKRGIAIHHGSSILALEPCVRLAGGLSFYVDATNLELCTMWSLKGQQQLRPRIAEDNSAYIARVEAHANWKLWRRFVHEEFYKDIQRAAVPPQNIVQIMIHGTILLRSEIDADFVHGLQRLLQITPRLHCCVFCGKRRSGWHGDD
jgi:hypothetical protein